MKTLGLSPKVLAPVSALFLAGVVLVVLGVVLPDETLRTLGYGALGSAIAAFPIGYAAGPGDVVPDPQDKASDDYLMERKDIRKLVSAEPASLESTKRRT